MSCPDASLMHALLDGALAPEQARTLERHIAECAECRAARGAAADLRDDATALLARTAVRPRSMPAFALLAARAAARTADSSAATADAAFSAIAPPYTPAVTVAPPSPMRSRRLLTVQAAGIAAAACVGWFAYGMIKPAAFRPASNEVAAAAAPVTEGTQDRAASLRLAAAPPAVRGAPKHASAAGRSSLRPRVQRVEGVASVSAAAPSISTPSVVVGPDLSPVAGEAAADRATAATVPILREPPVRIQPLEPGTRALTVRSDDDYKLRESLDDEEFFNLLEFAAPLPVERMVPAAVRLRTAPADTVTRAALRRP